MSFRIKIHLPGGYEFEASDDEESLSDQFDGFLKLLGSGLFQNAAPPVLATTEKEPDFETMTNEEIDELAPERSR
jgi:hypothetical protein